MTIKGHAGYGLLQLISSAAGMGHGCLIPQTVCTWLLARIGFGANQAIVSRVKRSAALDVRNRFKAVPLTILVTTLNFHPSLLHHTTLHSTKRVPPSCSKLDLNCGPLLRNNTKTYHPRGHPTNEGLARIATEYKQASAKASLSFDGGWVINSVAMMK